MEKITKNGIKLLKFNPTETELIILTLLNGSEVAYMDLFDSILDIEPYFLEMEDPEGRFSYKPLPRLKMSLDVEIEGYTW